MLQMKEMLRKAGFLKERVKTDFSEKPGLTLYLTPKGYEKVREIILKADYIVAEEQFSRVNGNMFSLRLPTAIFGMSFGGCQLYLEADAGWGEARIKNKPIALNYDRIVKIKGFSGEQWQNWHYTSKGKPKPRFTG